MTTGFCHCRTLIYYDAQQIKDICITLNHPCSFYQSFLVEWFRLAFFSFLRDDSGLMKSFQPVNQCNDFYEIHPTEVNSSMAHFNFPQSDVTTLRTSILLGRKRHERHLTYGPGMMYDNRPYVAFGGVC
jgi:hypothetical protein